MHAIDILGFIGAVCTLTAFLQVSRGAWHGQSVRYQFTNLVAGVLLLVYAWAKHAYANVLLNGVWCIVAVFGLLVARRLLSSRKQRRVPKKP